MIYKFFDKKKGSRARATSKMAANVDAVLAEELHKPVAKKFKRSKTLFKV